MKNCGVLNQRQSLHVQLKMVYTDTSSSILDFARLVQTAVLVVSAGMIDSGVDKGCF